MLLAQILHWNVATRHYSTLRARLNCTYRLYQQRLTPDIKYHPKAIFQGTFGYGTDGNDEFDMSNPWSKQMIAKPQPRVLTRTVPRLVMSNTNTNDANTDHVL